MVKMLRNEEQILEHDSEEAILSANEQWETL
jgi:hypothetical protein